MRLEIFGSRQEMERQRFRSGWCGPQFMGRVSDRGEAHG